MLDMFRVGDIKAELEKTKQERDQAVQAYQALRATFQKIEHLNYQELQQAINQLVQERTRLLQEVDTIQQGIARQQAWWNAELSKLQQQAEMRQREVVILDDEILLQSYGLYQPTYDLVNTEAYKAKLDQIRQRQTAMVKAGTAATSPANMSLNNDRKEGERMIKDYTKLILRAFNNESDTAIGSVKFSNVEAIGKRLRKAYDTLNSLGSRLGIAITFEYLSLKLEELHLCYEYQIKKQEEKEEQRRIREQLREEARVQREIEEAKSKVEKELNHFNRALSTISAQLQRATDETQRALLEQEKASIEQHLLDSQHTMEDVLNRERNTRAGYVYIISNIGSFGENVYKIGLTRRLEPQERIDELGDASVPFRFDVHALIFSEDAPALENALHQAFANQRVNMINARREFFRVSLGEIEDVVRKNFSKPVELIHLAEAAEFRQSLAQRAVGAA